MQLTRLYADERAKSSCQERTMRRLRGLYALARGAAQTGSAPLAARMASASSMYRVFEHCFVSLR